MRQQDLQDEEERMQKRRDVSSSNSIVGPAEVEYSSTAVPSFTVEADKICSSQQSSAAPIIRQPLSPR
ncbi:hypothetical protein LguiA_029357 [Lonicera macranthoides]